MNIRRANAAERAIHFLCYDTLQARSFYRIMLLCIYKNGIALLR